MAHYLYLRKSNDFACSKNKPLVFSDKEFDKNVAVICATRVEIAAPLIPIVGISKKFNIKLTAAPNAVL